MRSRSFVIVALVLGALLATGMAAFAYDHARRETIAEGIRVDGIDLSGLTRSQAQARLRRELLGRLDAPIVVHHASRSWTMRAREARVAADIQASVDEAVRRSRAGGLPTRVWRSLTGGHVDDDLLASVTYSDGAIVRLLDRIRAAVDRRPVDAQIRIDLGGPRATPDRDGLDVDAGRLHAQIRRAIGSTTASRSFVATTHHVPAKVTTQALLRQYGTLLVVNRHSFTLALYKSLRFKQRWSIAVGMQGLETPAGLYHIQNKVIDPAWHVPNSTWAGKLAGKVVPSGDPKNPIKARWLGIFDGAGIHGIDPGEYGTIGHAASHGCVRMRIADVEALYPQVPVGAPIYIA